MSSNIISAAPLTGPFNASVFNNSCSEPIFSETPAPCRWADSSKVPQVDREYGALSTSYAAA